jgi:hypothetical protein
MGSPARRTLPACMERSGIQELTVLSKSAIPPEPLTRPGGLPRYGQSLLLNLAAVMLQNMASDFELLSALMDIETIAVNLSIRERQQLRAQFGGRRWRKLKGVGRVRFPNGAVRLAELHWYEAHGIGRRKMKVKRVLD